MRQHQRRRLREFKWMLARVVAFVVCVLWASTLEATIILGWRQPEHIILAADSLVTSLEDPTARIHTCKVRRAGKFWFVLGGQIGFGDSEPDAFAVTTRAI